MQDQCIRFNHLDCTSALIDSVAIIKLNCTEIGEQENIGCCRTNLESVVKVSIFNGCTLRSKPHCHPIFLCRSGKDQVNFLCLISSPRHRGNQQGGLNLSPKYSLSRINLCEIKLRHSLMDKTVTFQTSCQMWKIDIF